MKKLSIQTPVLIAVAVVIMGGSFYGGMAYAKTSTKGSASSFRQGMPNGITGRQGAVGARMGGAGGFTTGEVVSKNANGFTVKLRDGGSKIVITASSTAIGKMTQGSMDDVTDGTSVVVSGTSNSDGSITATTVQIRPAGEIGMPGFGGPGGPEGRGSATSTAPEIK